MNKHFFSSESYQLIVKYSWVRLGHVSELNILIRTRILLQLSKVFFNYLVKAFILNLAYLVKKKSLIYLYMNMQWYAHKKWAERCSYYYLLFFPPCNLLKSSWQIQNQNPRQPPKKKLMKISFPYSQRKWSPQIEQNLLSPSFFSQCAIERNKIILCVSQIYILLIFSPLGGDCGE